MTTRLSNSPLLAPRQRFTLRESFPGGCYHASASTFDEAVTEARRQSQAIAARGFWKWSTAVVIVDAEAREREVAEWSVAGGIVTPTACRCVPDVAFTRDGEAVRAGEYIKGRAFLHNSSYAVDVYVQDDPRFAYSIFSGRVETADCLAVA